MKRPGLLPAFCAATLFLGLPCLALSAEPAMTPRPGLGSRQQQLLERFDRNHDGKLDDDERADAKEAMLKEQLDRQAARSKALPGGADEFRALALALFDRDGDGQLDESERAAAEKFAETYRGSPGLTPDTIKRFDRDGNGRIDDEERAALESHLNSLRAENPAARPAPVGMGPPEMRRELLQRFDRNENGRIDPDEVGALDAAIRPRIEQTPAQLRRFDRNNDGQLDDAEWKRARALLLAWLNSAPPVKPAAPAASSDDALGADAGRWVANLPNPPPPPSDISDEQRRAEADARLRSVAEEIARRRIEQEARLKDK